MAGSKPLQLGAYEISGGSVSDIGRWSALAVGLIVVYLGMAGVGARRGRLVRTGRSLGSFPGRDYLDRTVVFLQPDQCGLSQELDGPTKNIVIPKLMPAALNWFRHGATVTVLAGIVLYGYLYAKGGTRAIALGSAGCSASP